MEILVCIKQVPDDSVEISMNTNTGKPALDGIAEVVNAFDTYALEMATRLKEAKGGVITALSIGGETTNNSLKNCLAVGADEAFLIKDELYQESETILIAEKLAKAIKGIEKQKNKKFDLIFCGKESTDFASGQVGIMLADILGYGIATNLIDIDTSENKVLAKKETEDGYQKIELDFPAVLTVNKPNYEPRYPTIKSKMAARKKNIEQLTIDIDNKNKKFIEEIKIFAPAKRQAGIKLKEGSVEELVAEAIKKMTEDKVL